MTENRPRPPAIDLPSRFSNSSSNRSSMYKLFAPNLVNFNYFKSCTIRDHIAKMTRSTSNLTMEEKGVFLLINLSLTVSNILNHTQLHNQENFIKQLFNQVVAEIEANNGDVIFMSCDAILGFWPSATLDSIYLRINCETVLYCCGRIGGLLPPLRPASPNKHWKHLTCIITSGSLVFDYFLYKSFEETSNDIIGTDDVSVLLCGAVMRQLTERMHAVQYQDIKHACSNISRRIRSITVFFTSEIDKISQSILCIKEDHIDFIILSNKKGCSKAREIINDDMMTEMYDTMDTDSIVSIVSCVKSMVSVFDKNSDRDFPVIQFSVTNVEKPIVGKVAMFQKRQRRSITMDLNLILESETKQSLQVALGFKRQPAVFVYISCVGSSGTLQKAVIQIMSCSKSLFQQFGGFLLDTTIAYSSGNNNKVQFIITGLFSSIECQDGTSICSAAVECGAAVLSTFSVIGFGDNDCHGDCSVLVSFNEFAACGILGSDTRNEFIPISEGNSTIAKFNGMSSALYPSSCLEGHNTARSATNPAHMGDIMINADCYNKISEMYRFYQVSSVDALVKSTRGNHSIYYKMICSLGRAENTSAVGAGDDRIRIQTNFGSVMKAELQCEVLTESSAAPNNLEDVDDDGIFYPPDVQFPVAELPHLRTARRSSSEPFVGRENEVWEVISQIDEFTRILATFSSSDECLCHQQSILVAGEAGSGKSRFMEEIAYRLNCSYAEEYNLSPPCVVCCPSSIGSSCAGILSHIHKQITDFMKSYNHYNSVSKKSLLKLKSSCDLNDNDNTQDRQSYIADASEGIKSCIISVGCPIVWLVDDVEKQDQLFVEILAYLYSNDSLQDKRMAAGMIIVGSATLPSSTELCDGSVRHKGTESPYMFLQRPDIAAIFEPKSNLIILKEMSHFETCELIDSIIRNHMKLLDQGHSATFDSIDMKAIHDESKGSPGKIVQIMQQILSSGTVKRRHSSMVNHLTEQDAVTEEIRLACNAIMQLDEVELHVLQACAVIANFGSSFQIDDVICLMKDRQSIGQLSLAFVVKGCLMTLVSRRVLDMIKNENVCQYCFTSHSFLQIIYNDHIPQRDVNELHFDYFKTKYHQLTWPNIDTSCDVILYYTLYKQTKGTAETSQAENSNDPLMILFLEYCVRLFNFLEIREARFRSTEPMYNSYRMDVIRFIIGQFVSVNFHGSMINYIEDQEDSFSQIPLSEFIIVHMRGYDCIINSSRVFIGLLQSASDDEIVLYWVKKLSTCHNDCDSVLRMHWFFVISLHCGMTEQSITCCSLTSSPLSISQTLINSINETLLTHYIFKNDWGEVGGVLKTMKQHHFEETQVMRVYNILHGFLLNSRSDQSTVSNIFRPFQDKTLELALIGFRLGDFNNSHGAFEYLMDFYGKSGFKLIAGVLAECDLWCCAAINSSKNVMSHALSLSDSTNVGVMRQIKKISRLSHFFEDPLHEYDYEKDETSIDMACSAYFNCISGNYESIEYCTKFLLSVTKTADIHYSLGGPILLYIVGLSLLSIIKHEALLISDLLIDSFSSLSSVYSFSLPRLSRKYVRVNTEEVSLNAQNCLINIYQELKCFQKTFEWSEFIWRSLFLRFSINQANLFSEGEDRERALQLAGRIVNNPAKVVSLDSRKKISPGASAYNCPIPLIKKFYVEDVTDTILMIKKLK